MRHAGKKTPPRRVRAAGGVSASVPAPGRAARVVRAGFYPPWASRGRETRGRKASTARRCRATASSGPPGPRLGMPGQDLPGRRSAPRSLALRHVRWLLGDSARAEDRRAGPLSGSARAAGRFACRKSWRRAGADSVEGAGGRPIGHARGRHQRKHGGGRAQLFIAVGKGRRGARGHVVRVVELPWAVGGGPAAWGGPREQERCAFGTWRPRTTSAVLSPAKPARSSYEKQVNRHGA